MDIQSYITSMHVGSMDDMFGSSAPAAPTAAPTVAPMIMAHHEPVPQVDDSLIEQWERQKRAELQKRREEGSKKVSAQNEVGKGFFLGYPRVL